MNEFGVHKYKDFVKMARTTAQRVTEEHLREISVTAGIKQDSVTSNAKLKLFLLTICDMLGLH